MERKTRLSHLNSLQETRHDSGMDVEQSGSIPAVFCADQVPNLLLLMYLEFLVAGLRHALPCVQDPGHCECAHAMPLFQGRCALLHKRSFVQLAFPTCPWNFFKRIYDHCKIRPEDSPTFKVSY